VGRKRIRVGLDVDVVRETAHGLDLEGRARLRPGQPIEIVLPRAGGGGWTSRRAEVWSWVVYALGSGGPVYRGFCRWN